MILAPAIAMAAVGVGLRIGGGDTVRAAIVSGAPAPSGEAEVTWPIVVFDEDRGIREGVPGVPLDAVATGGGASGVATGAATTSGATTGGATTGGATTSGGATTGGAPGAWRSEWHGATNEDGAAEMTIRLRPGPAHLEVRSAGKRLTSGEIAWPAAASHDAWPTGWARFARREGDVALDVAVLGQRVASGFPASVWVHASDAKTGATLAGATLSLDPDPGLRAAQASATTDDRGWAHFTATPLGYSVPFVLHAKAADGRAGEWAGGLFVSPGASGIAAKDVYAPDENVAFDVSVPTVRTTAYVEIDSAAGRIWAAAAPLQATSGGMPRASLVGPKLPPGLYAVVAAGDPAGAAGLGPGTIARPFFVAATPDDALRFGTDAATCVAPGDVRLLPRTVSACLSLVAPAPVPRWVAIDGFVDQRARDAAARARGLAVALGAIAIAVVLEAILLLRTAAAARVRLAAAESSESEPSEAAGRTRVRLHRAWSVAVGLLLAMLGFTLLAAFLVRLG